MPIMRRARGFMLRLVRRRALSISLGLALAIPAAWIEWTGVGSRWWMQGLGLVLGATGIAIAWTGLTGPNPDWIE